MDNRASKITLVVDSTNVKQDFEVNHAERLLRMPDNGGWKLPEDSKYQFDKVNGIKRRQHKEEIEATK